MTHRAPSGKNAGSQRPCSSRNFVVGFALCAVATACSAGHGDSSPGSAKTGNLHASGGKAPSGRTFSVAAENRAPGTQGWRVTRTGGQQAIEGWADQTGVVTGGTVTLHVSTTAATYTVHAIRMGWYGGLEGREVWTSGPQPGVERQPFVIDPTRHTVVTNWPVSMTQSTAGWPPGSYLLRLDSSTGQRYVPLQVRRPTSQGSTVIVSADTTWQAYNRYGGYSLYNGSNGAFSTRARAVSFDRPYGLDPGQGQSEYLENEQPLVALAERQGLDVNYVSDVDLDADPQLLRGARSVVLTGHDEYWSSNMRNALLAFRDGGGNLGLLGANLGYRHIRFESAAGRLDRTEVCYKVPSEDPLNGTDNAAVTGQWRYPPDPRPESVITGVFYQSNPVEADMVVTDPAAWMLQGTNASAGMHLKALVKPEYDRVDLRVPTPRPMQIVTHSPLTVHGSADFSDSAYYTTPSGAGVFAVGTIGWINSLQGTNGPEAQAFTTKVTTNVLMAFAAGPAGRVHPAQDNVARFYRPSPTGARG